MSTLSRVIFDPDITPPTIPLSVAAIALSTSAIRVSWAAATDSGGSGLAGYRVYRSATSGGTYSQVGSDLSTASLQFDDTGLTASTTYFYRIRAFDGAGNQSGLSAIVNATTQALPVTNNWSANSPSYLPIVPGAACHGADQFGGSGRHLGAGNNSALLFIDTFGNGTSGSFDSVTRIGYGTSKYCANYPEPRHVIPLIAGVIDSTVSGSRNFIIDQPYMTFHGHAAPGHLVYRGSLWVTNATNLCLMHLAIFQDIYTDPVQADSSGDCTQLLLTSLPDRVLWANSAFWFATDESVDWFRPITNSGLWQCFIGQPITQGNHPEGAHNYGMILANTATPISLSRTVFAHCQARHPLTSSPRLSVTNCLIYNWGDTGVQIINTAPVVTDTNVEGCLFITGPNTNGNDAIRIYSTAAAGTRVYLGGNRAIGLADANQTDLLENSAGLTLQGSRLTGAHPAGHVVTSITNEEDFAELVLRYAGPRPMSRNQSVQNVVGHINARIAGSGNQGGFVTTPTAAGGYPAISNVGPINPADPGAHWGGVPCPMNLATRNLVAGNGHTAVDNWSHGVASLVMPTGWMT